jgi:hypothetical protein
LQLYDLLAKLYRNPCAAPGQEPNPEHACYQNAPKPPPFPGGQ